MHKERFTVASIQERRQRLTEIQRKLLDFLWQHYVLTGEAYPRRGITEIIEEQSEEDAFRGLNGSLLFQRTEANEPVYGLTIPGALLTSTGPFLAQLVIRCLDAVREAYRQDNFRKEIKSDEIVKYLVEMVKVDPGLLGTDHMFRDIFIRRQIGRLLRLYGLPGLPVSLSSISSDGAEWSLRIGHEVVDLNRAKDTEAYLDEFLSAAYDPDEPVFEPDRSRYHLQRRKAVPSKRSGRKANETTNTQPSPSPNNENGGEASSALSATRTEAVAERDLLGRENLTQALFRLLTEREDEDAFAIGLFGHWGAGKSSQIDFLKEALEKSTQPRILVAEFNAWKHEKADNLAAMLAQSVVDALVAEKSFWKKLQLAFRLAILRHIHNRKAFEEGKRFWALWLARLWVLSPYLIAFSPLLLLFWMPGWAVLIPVSLGAVSTALSVYHFMRSHLTEWFKHVDLNKAHSLLTLPDYSAHRGLVLDIHRTLEDLCKDCLQGASPSKGSYLLVVVDDLDRCGMDKIKEVLDAVRLVANIPRVVTLVAIDERVAFAAVEKHIKDSGHGGEAPELVAREYLAKVLQISVRLPNVDGNLVESYVDNKLFVEIGDNPIAKDNVEQMAPSPISPPTGPVESPALHMGASKVSKSDGQPAFLPQEKALFKELAKVYGFSNPRLLWRLNMAWKLLKSLHFGPQSTYDFEQAEAPMRLLFWDEWLHQRPNKERLDWSKWIDGGNAEAEPPKDMPDESIGHLIKDPGKAKGAGTIASAVLLPAKPEIYNSDRY